MYRTIPFVACVYHEIERLSSHIEGQSCCYITHWASRERGDGTRSTHEIYSASRDQVKCKSCLQAKIRSNVDHEILGQGSMVVAQLLVIQVLCPHVCAHRMIDNLYGYISSCPNAYPSTPCNMHITAS